MDKWSTVPYYSESEWGNFIKEYIIWLIITYDKSYGVF